LGLAVFVVFVVLAAGVEALLPRRSRVRAGAVEEGADLPSAPRSGPTPIRGCPEMLAGRAIEHHADRRQATSCSSSSASP
jgi:hypothetical protein